MIYPTNNILDLAVEVLAGNIAPMGDPITMSGIYPLTSANSDDVIPEMIDVSIGMSNPEFSKGAVGELSNTYAISFTNAGATDTTLATHIHFTDDADIHFVLAAVTPFTIPVGENTKTFPARSLVLRIRAAD